MGKLWIILMLIGTTAFGQLNVVESFTIGEVRQVVSKVLDETRTLNIYLPNSYTTDSLREYPVIFLLDGSKDEDFIHISGLVQFGSFPWLNKVEESIVVGIENIDRKRDFTHPPKDSTYKINTPTAGGSANFIRFIAQELQPMINRTYRTNGQRTLIGQSLGGLLATEILLKHNELFDKYIIISPSLWWDNERLLQTEFPSSIAVESVYIGVGKEGRIMRSVAKKLYKKVKGAQLEGTKIIFNYFKQCDHGDVLHLAVYDAFEKL